MVNQINLHMFMTLEEFIVALERGTGAKFRVFEKQTWIRKQIVFIVESMRDKKSSKHCVSFGTEKHCKMNSFGYSDTGFDFTRNSVTLTDQLSSLLEHVGEKEYVEIKQPIFSTSIEKWLQS